MKIFKTHKKVVWGRIFQKRGSRHILVPNSRYVGGLECGKVCCNDKDTKRKSLSNKRKISKRKYAACIQCIQYLRNIDMVDKYLFINVALIC